MKHLIVAHLSEATNHLHCLLYQKAWKLRRWNVCRGRHHFTNYARTIVGVVAGGRVEYKPDVAFHVCVARLIDDFRLSKDPPKLSKGTKMAKKSSAALDMSKISRPKPPKVLNLGVKDKDSFARRAKRRFEKLKATRHPIGR